MSTLERAIEIAAKAHAGQIDKAGEPYILHPLRLMLSMDSDVGRIVAVLHDVVEDSGITLDQLRAEGRRGCPGRHRRANKARRRVEDGAAARAKANAVALRVKLADNADNQDMTRSVQSPGRTSMPPRGVQTSSRVPAGALKHKGYLPRCKPGRHDLTTGRPISIARRSA